MDELVRSLQALSQAKRLVPAEQLIMSEVGKLDTLLLDGIAEDSLECIENILLSFFSVNGGKISTQCSLFIGDYLVNVYRLMKSPQIFDLLTLAITSGSTPAILGAGNVCLKIGDRFKAQLPRFVEFLISGKSHAFARVFALRACFKAGRKSMSEMISPAFEFIKKLLLRSTQASLVMELRFLKSIIWIQGAPIDRILVAVKAVYVAEKTPVVRNDIAVIVARCALAPLYPRLKKKARDRGEWVVTRNDNQNKDLDGPLAVIVGFGKLVKQVLSHFLNLLPTAMIARNAIPLFWFVRANCPGMMSQLIPLFPEGPKYDLIQAIAKESPSPAQLKLIVDMSPGKGVIVNAASIALTLAVSAQKDGKKAAVNFFGTIARSHPNIVLPYLRVSLLYITKPRESDAKVRGNSAVACAILRNFPRIEDAVLPNRSVLERFVAEVFQDVAYSWRFAEAFGILSLVPDEYVRDSNVSDAVLIAATFLADQQQSPLWSRLLKTVLRFRVRHKCDSDNNLLIVTAMNCRGNIPLSVLNSLELLTVEPEIAFEVARRILPICGSVKPSQELIRRYVKRMLPSGSDLLLRFAAPKQVDEYLDSVIQNFPEIFKKCLTNEKTCIFQTLMKYDSPMALLFVLAISQQLPAAMPKQLHTVLFDQLQSTNINILHIVAEIIANFVVKYPHTIHDVFNFMDANGTFTGCSFLLGAICMRTTIDRRLISRALAFIDRTMKNSATIPFALYALSALLATQSMQLTDAGIDLSLATVLLQTTHSNIGMQPIVFHLVTECLSSLIEMNSSAMACDNDTQFVQLASLMVRTIENTPISYAKIAFFNIARSVIAFARSIAAQIVTIKFPDGAGHPMTLLLTACEAFSDYMRFGYVDIQTEMIEPVLLILQKSSNSRAAGFLEALATGNEYENWVPMIRRILLTNALFEDDISAIEPNISVKVVLLRISMTILERLAADPEFDTEFLDDIVASVCHAISGGQIEIQEAAFPVLERVISLFKGRKAVDGGRLLELYDVQFTPAVDTGFQINLVISGGFLSAYLVFITEGLFNDAIIMGYIGGMRECLQRNCAAYYTLLTRLCWACHGHVDDDISAFLVEQRPNMVEALLQIMQIGRDDWRGRAVLRERYAQCCDIMIPETVWLIALNENRAINANVLIAFFLMEMAFETEKWKVDGSLRAMPVVCEFMSKDIDPALMELVIETLTRYKDETYYIRVLEMCAKAENLSASAREHLLSLAMNGNFNANAFAYILRNDTDRKLVTFSLAIAEHFVNESAPLPLFFILFELYPGVVGFTIDYMLKARDHFKGSVLDILRTGMMNFRSCDDFLPVREIARFILQNIVNGGLQVLGSFLVSRPEIAISILKENVAKAVMLLARSDVHNCSTLLQFLHLSLDVMHSRDGEMGQRFACSVLSLIASVMNKFGTDPQRGPQITVSCVVFIVRIGEILGDKLEAAYDTIPADEAVGACSVLQLQIVKSTLRRNNANLRTFAKSAPKHRWGDDQLEALEIGD